MFSIDKNVPMPPAKRKRNDRFPFADMQIGDSFAFEGSSTGAIAQAVYVAAKAHFGATGYVSIRQMGKESRVWRVK